MFKFFFSLVFYGSYILSGDLVPARDYYIRDTQGNFQLVHARPLTGIPETRIAIPESHVDIAEIPPTVTLPQNPNSNDIAQWAIKELMAQNALLAKKYDLTRKKWYVGASSFVASLVPLIVLATKLYYAEDKPAE